MTILTRDGDGERGDGDRDDDGGGDCDYWGTSCDSHHLVKYTCHGVLRTEAVNPDTKNTPPRAGSVHIWTFEIQGYSRLFKAI